MTMLSALMHALMTGSLAAGPPSQGSVDPSSIRGKILTGYQGWFRCPGDLADKGWYHWSWDSQRIAPDTLTFEMWPDMGEYSREERFPAPGFTLPDGSQAELFSSDHPKTVLRHFQWMKEFQIDGAFLQHFLVGLPGGPEEARYPSRRRVMEHVRKANQETGRVWALSYDMAGMPVDRIFEVLTQDWKRMVEEGIPQDPRYLHEAGLPVVQVWGFYYQNAHNPMTVDLANRIIDFFQAPGPCSAFLVGGGDWNWRQIPDPGWQAFTLRFNAYCPWNVGNYWKDEQGQAHASTQTWAQGKGVCSEKGVMWIPVLYPGFSWDNLTRKPAGSSNIPRRGGLFLWEQFVEAAKMGQNTVYVAMFDEVDEGTAIFKVTSAPPVQAHFVGFEGLESDRYLKLVREGARMLRGETPVSAEMPGQK